MRRIAWGAALAAAMLCWPAAVGAQTPEIFPLPAGHTTSNFGVAPDNAGNVWFSVQAPPAAMGQPPVASLARMKVSELAPGTSNGMSFFPTPDPPMPSCCATQVRSLAYSAGEDRVYYVRSEGSVGYGIPNQMSPGTTGGITMTHLPGYQDLWDVAAAPGGGVWFTERSSSNVPPYYGARVAFWNGGDVLEGPNVAIQGGNSTINSLRYDSKPSGIAVGADGLPWFVEEDPGNPGYRIARYSGTGDTYQEYLAQPCAPTPPCSGSFTGTGLTDVTVAKDGTVWFTNALKKTFGRFDPISLQITQYALVSADPTLNGTPRTITTAPDGSLWMGVFGGFTASTSNAVVKIVPQATAAASPTATVYKVGPSTPVLGVAADNAGNVWFGLASPSPPGAVGRLAGVVTPGGTAPPGTTPPPAPAPSGPTPVTVTAATVGTATLTPPQVGNGAINTNQVCAGPPHARCSVIYLIKEREYVTGFPGAGAGSAAKKKKKPKPRVLATKTVTLKGGEKAKVTITLGKLGKRILKSKGRLTVVYTATQKLSGGKTKVLTRKTVTFKRRKK